MIVLNIFAQYLQKAGRDTKRKILKEWQTAYSSKFSRDMVTKFPQNRPRERKGFEDLSSVVSLGRSFPAREKFRDLDMGRSFPPTCGKTCFQVANVFRKGRREGTT